ncbi:methyl-accepting chemotaxis protein [Motiliproteus sediminis]|uniref:methyl-accepting chemotaxis protein n=1 Tax=Motiliproteus sediminis TaxID=1468178 RepID=UPI001AEFE72D|nr:methyl-accepting chemotaxis protein [Motiliproteus sediminis]
MQTIRAKLAAIFIAVLAIVVAVTLGSFYGLKLQLGEYQSLISEEAALQSDILRAQSDFKIQVQEWKNVLLRGADDKQREKYWGRFQEREATVQAAVTRMSERVAELTRLDEHYRQSPLAQLINDFINAHKQMGTAYRKGYQAFVAAGYDHRAGDKAVSGIDRAPTKLLDEAVAEVDKIMQVDVDEASAATAALLRNALILLIISVVGGALLFIYMSNRIIVRPAQALSGDLKHLAEGDFSQEILHSANDEIGGLADSARTLQESIAGILATLLASAEKTNSASQHLMGAGGRAREIAEDQHAQTTQVATAINQMSATVQDVAQSAQEAASAAVEADKQARNGHTVVNETVSAINALASEIERAAGVIESVNSDSREIGGILDVIRGIAEQTNLLALNAAIEAARAGDQGRGFAVVADEVRSLAQRTQESTEEIQRMIERLQRGAQSAVEVMTSSQSQAQQGVDKASAAGDALDKIEQAIGRISDMNLHIASAAEEQSVVAEEINQNVTAIAGITEQSLENAETVAQVSQEVALLSEEFSTITNRFKV